MPMKLIGLMMVSVLTVSPCHAASFNGLGSLGPLGSGSWAEAISDDGTVVVGTSESNSSFQAFRWTRNGGMIGLGDLEGGEFFSTASGVSDDGSVIVGSSGSTAGREAFRWTAPIGMFGLGDIGGGEFRSVASDVSADGTVVVGTGETTLRNTVGFRWTEQGGMTPAGGVGLAAVTNDGSTMTGWAAHPTEQGLHAIVFNDDGTSSYLGLGGAVGLSGDGATIVGYRSLPDDPFYEMAVRWTRSGAMTELGHISGHSGSNFLQSTAHAVSADGAIVVGQSTAPDGREAFIWDEENGMRSFRDLLASNYGLADELDGWLLDSITDISGDGTVMVGRGINPLGNPEGWIAMIPEPSTPIVLGLGILAHFSRRCGVTVRYAITNSQLTNSQMIRLIV